MRLKDIHIRDPFILAYNNNYYMYGTPTEDLCGSKIGFWCMKSKDLREWSEPIKCFTPPEDFWGRTDFWAPEVHYYNGCFYLFATFMANGYMRAVQILKSSKPEGPYTVWSCPITPDDCMCLDGTFFLENGIPYMVYCHEWVQIGTGEICAIKMKEDLSAPDGAPFTLFSASDAAWVDPVINETINNKPAMVTDGPYIFKDNGILYMIWSSFYKGKYAMGCAVSQNGRLAGPWEHSNKLVLEQDGGHGMVFEAFDGSKKLILHQPNSEPMERPRLFEVKMEGKQIQIID